jgi:2-oxoglutarate ferredoxin oxidoreductase subunit alpha
LDYTIKIGGEAGQGIQTVGEVLSAAFAKSGFHVFTHQDYESRIRGGHNFYQIRVANKRVMSSTPDVDIVVALDRAGIELHRQELRKDGVIAYDSEDLKASFEGPEMLDIPLRKLAVEEGGGPVMANTVAVGAVLGMLGMGINILEDLLASRFGKKGDAVVEGNIRAARAGFDYAKKHCRQCRFIPRDPSGKPK